jgi:hypothetical protein
VRWVEHKSYTGPDRRKRKPTLRFGERRVSDIAENAPPLGAALRQLRIYAMDAHDTHKVRAFIDRARMAAHLAEARGEPEVKTALLKLADLVAAQPGEDWRERLAFALEKMSARFDVLSVEP